MLALQPADDVGLAAHEHARAALAARKGSLERRLHRGVLVLCMPSYTYYGTAWLYLIYRRLAMPTMAPPGFTYYSAACTAASS